jgi:hypothetical protein
MDNILMLGANNFEIIPRHEIRMEVNVENNKYAFWFKELQEG